MTVISTIFPREEKGEQDAHIKYAARKREWMDIEEIPSWKKRGTWCTHLNSVPENENGCKMGYYTSPKKRGTSCTLLNIVPENENGTSWELFSLMR